MKSLNSYFTKFIILLFAACFSGCDFALEDESGNISSATESSEATLTTQNRVVKIVDGDTYDLLIDGVQTRIRMEGIDAPERGMDYYKVSKEYLGELCLNQRIRIEGTKKDRYGRLLAKSYLDDGRELGEEMVKAGMAWHFKKYSSDETLSQLENEARASRLGLWAYDNPTPPWEYRKQKRNK